MIGITQEGEAAGILSVIMSIFVFSVHLIQKFQIKDTKQSTVLTNSPETVNICC